MRSVRRQIQESQNYIRAEPERLPDLQAIFSRGGAAGAMTLELLRVRPLGWILQEIGEVGR